MRYKERTPENIAHDIEWASWDIACAITSGYEIKSEQIKELKDLVEELITKIPAIKKSIY